MVTRDTKRAAYPEDAVTDPDLERVSFSKEDIGAELLPILTSGLYRDTLDALREYIQNAIDASSRHIRISIDVDTVSVADNGIGMTEEQARRAMRLGISDKNARENIGFRGIGIYSGFNLCDSVEIHTKAKMEDNVEISATAYKITFDFKQMRHDLLEEQQRRTAGLSPALYLERLLERSVYMEPDPDHAIDDHGTTVIMNGLLSDAYLRLNDWNQVVNYLQDVVPLPFRPDFQYGSVIQEKFDREDYRVVPLTLKLGERREELYRPYTNEVFTHGGQHVPEFFEVKGKEVKGKSQNFGFAWVCTNDAREIIADVKLRGLIIKKYGFSIGDRRFLEPYFGRTVYSRRSTGEVIIKHPDLIPNAARSDFENNSARQEFLEALPQLTRSIDAWANKLQETDRAREVLAEITAQLSEITDGLPAIQRDNERLLHLNADLADVERRLKLQAKRLRKIDDEGLGKAQLLLQGAQDFVREALTQRRRSQKKLEEEVIRAVQRQSLTPTPDERARLGDVPTDLVRVLDVYGLLDSSDLRAVLRFFDQSILKKAVSDEIYSSMIREFRDYLEESL